MSTKTIYAQLISLAFLLTLLFSQTIQAQVQVKEVTTRADVKLRFIYAKADNAVASAVLLQGGTGSIGIYPNGTVRDAGFLSDGASRFNLKGVSVAIPDVPSDRRSLNDFRATPEHALDIAALIDFLRRESKAPVYVVGISNGSLSAVSAAVHLKENRPDGIVLTSTVTKEGVSKGMAHVVFQLPLQNVQIPALLVHHTNDGCYVSPYSGVKDIASALKSSPRVDVISVEGGSSGNPCHGGFHQYAGIESRVTQSITDWMKQQQVVLPK